MDRLSPPVLCLVYLLLLLLAAAIFSPLSYSLPALAPLLVILFTLLRPQKPEISVVLMVMVIFLVPLALAPMLGRLPNLPPLAARLIAVALVSRAGYLLDHHLRQRALHIPESSGGSSGRHITYTFISLFIAALVLMLLSRMFLTLLILPVLTDSMSISLVHFLFSPIEVDAEKTSINAIKSGVMLFPFIAISS